MSDADIRIPESLTRKWQSFVDIVARTSGFVSALVMRVDPPEIEVFVASRNDGNPFKPGDRAALDTDLYCEKVMSSRAAFHCPDALALDPPWRNPDVEHFGLVCYYGLPILWPDGKPFGTICILDHAEKAIEPDAVELMTLMRLAIEADLARLLTVAREVSASAQVRHQVEERYAAVFEQAAVGLARVGLDGSWLEVNDKMCSIVGFSRAELMSRTFQDITFHEDLREDLDLVDRLVKGDVPTYSLEKRYVHKQGHHVWVRLTVSLVRDHEGSPSYFISIVEDVTEMKALRMEVEQSQKLEALGRLAGGIAHEFNNKLATITGNLFLALRQPARSAQYVAQAEKLCFQASEMIKSLLTYARRDQSDKCAVQLDKYLGEVVKNLRLVLPENIEFQIDIEDRPIWVEANATQLQQIVLNLVNNARDAVEAVEKPWIEVRLSSVPLTSDLKNKLPLANAKTLAVLEVGDNGSGIASSDVGKIFDPFYTTKPVGKGSGLGLAMVSSLVRGHGGLIEVESNVGAGACFRVYLRQLAEGERVEDAAADAHTVSDGALANILVVDDNDSVLDITSQVLEALGYRVIQARDGQEALGIYMTNDEIDCVLADVVMPNMGGVELWRKLKTYDDAVKLILMTGYNAEAAVKTMKCPVLYKPISPADLNATLGEVLGRRAAS